MGMLIDYYEEIDIDLFGVFLVLISLVAITCQRLKKWFTFGMRVLVSKKLIIDPLKYHFFDQGFLLNKKFHSHSFPKSHHSVSEIESFTRCLWFLILRLAMTRARFVHANHYNWSRLVVQTIHVQQTIILFSQMYNYVVTYDATSSPKTKTIDFGMEFALEISQRPLSTIEFTRWS